MSRNLEHDAIALAVGELAKRGSSPENIRRGLAIHLVNICRSTDAGELAALVDVNMAIEFWRLLKNKYGGSR